MKSVTSIILTLLLVIACNSKESLTAGAQEKIDVVHQYIDAVIEQDVEAMDNLLSADYISTGPALKTEVLKAQSIAGWKRGWEENCLHKI